MRRSSFLAFSALLASASPARVLLSSTTEQDLNGKIEPPPSVVKQIIQDEQDNAAQLDACVVANTGSRRMAMKSPRAKHVFFALFVFLALQSAFATSPCPADVKCGPTPFYGLILGLTQACSAKYPQNAAQYKARLEKLMAENIEAYRKLDSNADFAAKQNEIKRAIDLMTPAELRKECSRLLE